MTDQEQAAMAHAEFVQLVSNVFQKHGISEHQSDQYADQAMSDFEESECCTVGDPDYVWGHEGAEIMANEFIQDNLTE